MKTALLFLFHLALPALVPAQMVEKAGNLADLPDARPGFRITLFAKEPLVRNPCSLAFDERGRLFVSMGPQYRNPTPQTPPDQIVILTDRDGDGTADHSHVFAQGFNCIQGLAWHGRDLWVANAPDLTIVRDLDQDDKADEFIRVFTDLGNLEHGVHGLNWAPDGRLYLTKGNSKGINTHQWKQDAPWRVAPKSFRDLAGVPGPPDAPDFPPPQTFTATTYRRTWQDPADDWGRMGGVLRCEDQGANLEIVARGLRNPYGLAFDDQFNWLGTDQDQTEGDRLYMPFPGADFGWSHSWSTHWTGENHPPTVPVSGPVYAGSGTAVLWADAPHWPAPYRKIWLINDWLLKSTYLFRPAWDGALLQPEGGKIETFLSGKNALFRPVDMAFGADGALYITGWGRGYGVERDASGAMKNEGRLFRLIPEHNPSIPPPPTAPLEELSVADLISDFDSLLPVRRINAQDELVRRGEPVHAALSGFLQSGKLSSMAETWALWTLGRSSFPDSLFAGLAGSPRTPFNQRLQSLRILGQRQTPELASVLNTILTDPNARLRFAAVQAAHESKEAGLAPALLTLAEREADRLTRFVLWRALRDLLTPDQLRALTVSAHAGQRAAGLLALLDLQALTEKELVAMADDPDPGVKKIVSLALGKPAGSTTAVNPEVNSPDYFPFRNLVTASGRACTPAILAEGQPVYTDRPYLLKKIPESLRGAFMIRTPNSDDDSREARTLTFDLQLDSTLLVAHDIRIPTKPAWLEAFSDTDLTLSTNDTTYRLWAKDFPACPVVLGGNVTQPRPGKSNYFVIVQPGSLSARPTLTTEAEVFAALPKADPGRGEGLFFLSAACSSCHRIGKLGINFGPDLTYLGDRMEARFIVQSLLEPSAVITEGYAAHAVEAGGRSYFGMLLSTGKTLQMGLAGGTTVDLPSDTITKHETLPVSPMPPQGALLSPQQAADITVWLLTQKSPTAPAAPATTVAQAGFQVDQRTDRLSITWQGKPLADYVFSDPVILRPYFANLHTPSGHRVTRHHPPIPGQDATDHADMHPGFWLGFGDLNGHDFWRNKAKMQHLSFPQPPRIDGSKLTFTQDCQLVTAGGETLGTLTNHLNLTFRDSAFQIEWTAVLTAGKAPLVFGDQEEMGFGIRMASALTAKKGGRLLSSQGRQSAAAIWGQTAAWCDASGRLNGQPCGITLMAAPDQFRQPWWHVRDYGLMVANPFAPAAFKQGPAPPTTLPAGASLTLKSAAWIHQGTKGTPAAIFEEWSRGQTN